MASTYSPLLKIELIGVGDQNNTWGTTTNTNLGTLIEQAIAGTTTIDVTSGDVTLTNFNGTSDQARCAAIKVIGTPGVARSIIAPARSHIYVISNGSNSVVTIKTSTSTGLAVPVDNTYLVYYDPTVGVVDFKLVGKASATTNTANTLVLRDGSGNFAAGTITATLSGNVTGNVTGNLNGNLTAATPTAATQALTDNSTAVATTAFVRGIIPAGMIMLWYGSTGTIPTGWKLCDGTLGTPDLRDRFIVGAGATYLVNGTGGTADAIVVTHGHTFSGDALSGHAHGYDDAYFAESNNPPYNIQGSGRTDYDNGYVYRSPRPTTDSVSAGTPSGTVNTTGSSGTNANLPPYYALCYIMKS
jgi:hypothetical protein